MRAFTGLTLAEQREMLAQDMVQTPAQNADDIKALHRLWRIGDADAISAWAVAKSERLARSKALSDAIDNKIVYERNRRFVARMTAIAAPNRPLFVAIGALHWAARAACSNCCVNKVTGSTRTDRRHRARTDPPCLIDAVRAAQTPGWARDSIRKTLESSENSVSND